jgi:hypothetical protein
VHAEEGVFPAVAVGVEGHFALVVRREDVLAVHVQDDDAVVALVDLSGLRRNERTRVGEETRQGWRDRWM